MRYKVIAGGCKFGVLSMGSLFASLGNLRDKKAAHRHRAELSSAVADSIPAIPAGNPLIVLNVDYVD